MSETTTADADFYARFEAKTRELSEQLTADRSEWPRGWLIQFRDVLAYRALSAPG